MSLTKSTFAAATTGGSLGRELGAAHPPARGPRTWSRATWNAPRLATARAQCPQAGRCQAGEFASWCRAGSRASSGAGTWVVRWKTPRRAATATPRPTRAMLRTPKARMKRRPRARGCCGEAHCGRPAQELPARGAPRTLRGRDFRWPRLLLRLQLPVDGPYDDGSGTLGAFDALAHDVGRDLQNSAAARTAKGGQCSRSGFRWGARVLSPGGYKRLAVRCGQGNVKNSGGREAASRTCSRCCRPPGGRTGPPRRSSWWSGEMRNGCRSFLFVPRPIPQSACHCRATAAAGRCGPRRSGTRSIPGAGKPSP